MYTDVHVNSEAENNQATNCLTSMQEYQLQKTYSNSSTYTTGNTKKHPVHYKTRVNFITYYKIIRISGRNWIKLLPAYLL